MGRHVGQYLEYDRSEQGVLADCKDGLFYKAEGNEDWDRLIRMLDMSKEERDALFIANHLREDESSEDKSEDGVMLETFCLKLQRRIWAACRIRTLCLISKPRFVNFETIIFWIMFTERDDMHDNMK